MWKDVGVTISSAVVDTGAFLYDEGCVYIYYKTVITGYGSPYALIDATGDYKIVVVK